MINPKLENGKKMEDLAPKIICVFVLFSKWFDEIEKFGTEIEPNAMSLSTVSSDFSSLTRIVLL